MEQRKVLFHTVYNTRSHSDDANFFSLFSGKKTKTFFHQTHFPTFRQLFSFLPSLFSFWHGGKGGGEEEAIHILPPIFQDAAKLSKGCEGGGKLLWVGVPWDGMGVGGSGSFGLLSLLSSLSRRGGFWDVMEAECLGNWSAYFGIETTSRKKAF